MQLPLLWNTHGTVPQGHIGGIHRSHHLRSLNFSSLDAFLAYNEDGGSVKKLESGSFIF
jgi:hypothetical protein